LISSKSKFTTLNEKHLHIKLKEWLSQPGDRFEVDLDGYVIDIERQGLLIEIQTRNFSAIKRKLTALSGRYKVRLIFPIAVEKWIVKLVMDGETTGNRRKSPKRGDIFELFEELVSFPELMMNPNFTVETILIQEEEVRKYRKGSSWRRKGWSTVERRLLDIKERVLFETTTDLALLLPKNLPNSFTTAELSSTLNKPRRLCQKIAYCLRKMNVLRQVGRDKNGVIYEIARISPH